MEQENNVQEKIAQEKTSKPYYDKEDIMKLFDCGVTSAMNIIRAIRNVNGGGALPKGKVLIREYNAWLNYNVPKEEKKEVRRFYARPY